MPWDFLGIGPCSSEAGEGVGLESGGSGRLASSIPKGWDLHDCGGF